MENVLSIHRFVEFLLLVLFCRSYLRVHVFASFGVHTVPLSLSMANIICLYALYFIYYYSKYLPQSQYTTIILSIDFRDSLFVYPHLVHIPNDHNDADLPSIERFLELCRSENLTINQDSSNIMHENSNFI